MNLLTYPLAFLGTSTDVASSNAAIAQSPQQMSATAASVIARYVNGTAEHSPHLASGVANSADNVIVSRILDSPHIATATAATQQTASANILHYPHLAQSNANSTIVVNGQASILQSPHSATASATTTPAGQLYNLPTTTGLEMWLNAQNGVTGDPVTLWADQHTTGRDLSSFSNTLAISGTTYNGLGALNFSAPNISPSIGASFSASNTWAIFLVCTTTSDSIWMLSSNQVRIDTAALGDIRWVASGGNAIVASPTNPVASLNIYTFAINGSSGRIYQNGVEQFNGTIGDITSAWSRLPARAHGDITDWIIYSSIPSDAELNTIGTTLSNRYGLSWATI